MSEQQQSESALAPLAAAVATQSVVAFLVRMIPTLAPVLIVEASVAPSFIGYLAAVGTVGSMLFYLTGMPLIRRTGPVRIMQFGMVVAAAGTAMLALPVAAILVAGSLFYLHAGDRTMTAGVDRSVLTETGPVGAKAAPPSED